MAFFPKSGLTLNGGCFCKAVRYTVQIPALDERPLVPGVLTTPVSSEKSVETRLPVIALDHCQTCREISGALVQCWLICPAGWVDWDLLLRSETAEPTRIQLSTLDAAGPMKDGEQSSNFLTRFNATDRATRTFCSRCGTTLTYVSHKRPGPQALVDVTVGSLDHESLLLAKPDRHSWWDSGTDWIRQLLSKGDGGFLIKHPTGDISRATE